MIEIRSKSQISELPIHPAFRQDLESRIDYVTQGSGELDESYQIFLLETEMEVMDKIFVTDPEGGTVVSSAGIEWTETTSVHEEDSIHRFVHVLFYDQDMDSIVEYVFPRDILRDPALLEELDDCPSADGV